MDIVACVAESAIPVFKLARSLYEHLAEMKSNDKRIEQLKDNVRFLTSAIQCLRKEDMKETLVQDALNNLERILKDAVKQVEKHRNTSWLVQGIKVNSLAEQLKDINNQLSSALNNLLLSLSLEQRERMESLRKVFSDSCRIEKDQEDMKADKQNWKRSEMGVGELGSADVPPPGPIRFMSVQSDSVSLRWSPPEGAPGHRTFKVTRTGGQKHCNLQVTDVALEVTGLTPGEKYHFTVATLSQDGRQSTPVERAVCTAVPPPQNLQVDLRSLKATDVTWTKPAGVDQETYLLEIIKAGDQGVKSTVQSESCQYTVTNLQTPANYTINITTVVSNGRQSDPASIEFSTEAPPPQNVQVKVESLKATTFTWTKPAGVDQATYLLELIKTGDQGDKCTFKTDSCQYTITDLQVDADYTISITSVLSNGRQSKPVSKTFRPGCLVKQRACEYLTSVLGENPLLLTELNLYRKIPGDSGVKQFCPLLEDSRCRIKELKLGYCSITAEGCATLVSSLTSNPSHLILLDLDGNKLGDSGVQQISTLLRNPDCKLQTLMLGKCSITAEGCADLVSSLTSNPSHLTGLLLDNNKLGDSGVQQISTLLRNPDCKLQALGLDNCSITAEGCADLISSLTSNPSHLIELNLINNNLGDSGEEQIKALLSKPGCKLKILY